MDDKDDDDSDDDQGNGEEYDDDDDDNNDTQYYEGEPTKEWNQEVEDTIEEVEEGDLEEYLSEPESQIFTTDDDDL
jgi:hypothetical protein